MPQRSQQRLTNLYEIEKRRQIGVTIVYLDESFIHLGVTCLPLRLKQPLSCKIPLHWQRGQGKELAVLALYETS